MTQFQCRRVRTPVLAGLAALGLILGGAAAYAQTVAPPPPGATVGGVTVTAPRVIERNRVGVTSEELTMSIHVPYGDLNMRTPEGVATLDTRVREAANYLCGRLEAQYPEGAPELSVCARAAVSEAGPQLIKARNAG